MTTRHLCRRHARGQHRLGRHRDLRSEQSPAAERQHRDHHAAITTPLTAAGLDVAVTQTLLPGDSYEYVFTFAKALKISDIVLSATGTAANIANVEFGLTPATTMVFSTIVPTGAQAFGGASLPGGTFAKGSSFTIYWEDGIDAPVSITASFTTSAVPVPAALPLLAGALGALGLARRKFKKAA